MATIIVKATEKCNANCYYCDVVRKENTGCSMSVEVLEQLYRRIDEYLKEDPTDVVELLWHGGEPLLLGDKYYQKAAEVQNRYCSKTQNRIKHSMQTNLTCFSETFIPVFKKLGINSLGTSYDPEPNIRGIGKKLNSDTYNRKFMKSLAILDKNAIGWGMIYVVTKRSLKDPVKAFNFLGNLLLSGGFNMNPVLMYDENRQDISVTPEEYVDFLGKIFPIWWKNKERYPDVQPFKGLVDTIVHGNINLGCVDSGSCTYHHINVAPDGETSQCGRSADWGLLQYGNIFDKSLMQILHDEKRDELEVRVGKLYDSDCKGCRFWEICHGGCPLDAWSKHKSFMHKSEWCDARGGFIERYFEPVTGYQYQPTGALLPN